MAERNKYRLIDGTHGRYEERGGKQVNVRYGLGDPILLTAAEAAALNEHRKRVEYVGPADGDAALTELIEPEPDVNEVVETDPAKQAPPTEEPPPPGNGDDNPWTEFLANHNVGEVRERIEAIASPDELTELQGAEEASDRPRKLVLGAVAERLKELSA